MHEYLTLSLSLPNSLGFTADYDTCEPLLFYLESSLIFTSIHTLFQETVLTYARSAHFCSADDKPFDSLFTSSNALTITFQSDSYGSDKGFLTSVTAGT